MVIVPLFRSLGSWIEKLPEASALVCASGVARLLALNSTTIEFGSAVPVKTGVWLLVMPSPLTPVSSAGRMPSVGAAVGPWVSTVKDDVGLTVEPKLLVATTWKVTGPSLRVGNWRTKLPLMSLV